MSLGRAFAIDAGRYVAVAILYCTALAVAFPGGGTLVAGLVLAFFATFLLNSLLGAFVRSPERRALERALAGEPPVDGRMAALCGRLVATDAELAGPFSGKPCVAYSYWIGRTVIHNDGGASLVSDVRGFACAPCAIRTDSGDVGLRGLSEADLEAFAPRELSGPDVRLRIQQYLASAPFAPDGGPSLTAVTNGLRDLREELANPSRSTRRDAGDPDFELEPDHEFSETSIDPGRRVTVIGPFSSVGPELCPRGARQLTVLPGRLEDAEEWLEAGSTSRWLMALAMFAFAHLFLFTAIHGGAFD